MSDQQRFICCHLCVSIIDRAMDRFFWLKKNHEKLICAHCADGMRADVIEEAISASGRSSKVVFKTEQDELVSAPVKTIFVCSHCGKQHKDKKFLQTICGDEQNFKPVLAWIYSVKLNDRGFVQDFIPVSRKDN